MRAGLVAVSRTPLGGLSQGCETTPHPGDKEKATRCPKCGRELAAGDWLSLSLSMKKNAGRVS